VYEVGEEERSKKGTECSKTEDRNLNITLLDSRMIYQQLK